MTHLMGVNHSVFEGQQHIGHVVTAVPRAEHAGISGKTRAKQLKISFVGHDTELRFIRFQKMNFAKVVENST